VIIVGIDPGVEGALALLTDSGEIIDIKDMPVVEVRVGRTTRHRIAASELARIMRAMKCDHAVLEHVAGRPTDVPTYAGELCRAAGIVEGVIAALGIPWTSVQPTAWRKAMGVSLPPGSSTKSERKEASRQRSMQLWPAHAELFKRKKDADRSEAALIGRWGVLCASLGGMDAAA
jgi:crossover junction endodeoxyribonuclease RuvC